jgi:hypothetical protein
VLSALLISACVCVCETLEFYTVRYRTVFMIKIRFYIILSSRTKWKSHPLSAFIKNVDSYLQIIQVGRGQDGGIPYNNITRRFLDRFFFINFGYTEQFCLHVLKCRIHLFFSPGIFKVWFLPHEYMHGFVKRTVSLKIQWYCSVGHSGRAVWGVGLDRLVAGIMGSNPA